mgnify:CR=1 FL=1
MESGKSFIDACGNAGCVMLVIWNQKNKLLQEAIFYGQNSQRSQGQQI